MKEWYVGDDYYKDGEKFARSRLLIVTTVFTL